MCLIQCVSYSAPYVDVYITAASSDVAGLTLVQFSNVLSLGSVPG